MPPFAIGSGMLSDACCLRILSGSSNVAPPDVQANQELNNGKDCDMYLRPQTPTNNYQSASSIYMIQILMPVTESPFAFAFVYECMDCIP